jgi:hypothetical protein
MDAKARIANTVDPKIFVFISPLPSCIFDAGFLSPISNWGYFPMLDAESPAMNVEGQT